MEWNKPLVVALAAAAFVCISSLVQTAYYSKALDNTVGLFELKLSMIRPQTPVTPLSCPACPVCPAGIPEAVFKSVMQGLHKEATELRKQLQELREAVDKLPQQKPGRRSELQGLDAPDTKAAFRATDRGKGGTREEGAPPARKRGEPPAPTNSDTR